VAVVPKAFPAGCSPPTLTPGCTVSPSPEVSGPFVLPPEREVIISLSLCVPPMD